MSQRFVDDTPCPATQDQECLGLTVSKERKMSEFFNKWDIWNRRDDIWNAVLKENILAFVFNDTDIAVLGVLVMDDIEVFPLRFN